MMNRGPGAGRPPARGFGGGPGGIGGMLPPQKTKNVRRTVGLLLARLRPERGWVLSTSRSTLESSGATG